MEVMMNASVWQTAIRCVAFSFCWSRLMMVVKHTNVDFHQHGMDLKVMNEQFTEEDK